MAIRFALLKHYQDCIHFNTLISRIWGSGVEDELPLPVLVTIAKNDGGVLAAYSDDGPPELNGMIGMALWWLGSQKQQGTDSPQLKVCSHMAGVLGRWQGQGIGRQIKLKQRELVLQQGVTDWVTWTYDPLYRRNGVFNIHRLGAVCNTYARNIYGELNDDLNRGTPSDRCEVDWWLRSERVERAARGEPPNPQTLPNDLQVLPSVIADDGFCRPMETTQDFSSASLAVPLPADISAIRHADPVLGHDWRMYIREILENAFAAGYVMVDCVALEERWHYILTDLHIKETDNHAR